MWEKSKYLHSSAAFYYLSDNDAQWYLVGWKEWKRRMEDEEVVAQIRAQND